MNTRTIPKIGRTPGLILCNPVLHPITKMTSNHLSIFSKRISCISILPAPLILESLRQIPVVEGQKRLDPSAQ
jgi:hypothetical protein